MPNKIVLPMLALLLTVSACNKQAKTASESNQMNSAAQPSPAAAPQTMAQAPAAAPQAQTSPMPPSAAQAAPPVAPAPVVVPAGTAITVRLSQPIDSRTSKPGDTFTGELAQPISLHGKAVAPSSSTVMGAVVDAEAAGKLKGAGLLSVKLTSITIHGVPYTIQTSVLSNAIKGKGKRSATFIGGGAGGGALIGGLAGGGKGAAIGALLGGGGGTAGALMTGNKDISFPAESALTFRLQRPVTLKGTPAAESRTQGEEMPH
jgi:hypothetical protein